MIFDKLGYYDSDLMSGVHWIIRFIVFIFLIILFESIIKFFKIIFSFHWWVYIILLVIIAGLVVLLHIFRYRYINNKIKVKSEINKDESTGTKELVESKDETKKFSSYNKKDYCPRCGGLLVKRHGPYGDFYGCSNYSKKGCRYTRKFK